MPIIKWAPFLEPFEEMDKFFEDHFPKVSKGFTPAIDLYQTKDNVVVETPLAGVDPEKVDISIDNDVLTIKGESEKRSEVEDKDYFRKEVRYGSFYRSVALPTHVVGEKASATYDNGMLKVVIPKAPESKPKAVKIKVKSEKKAKKAKK